MPPTLRIPNDLDRDDATELLQAMIAGTDLLGFGRVRPGPLRPMHGVAYLLVTVPRDLLEDLCLVGEGNADREVDDEGDEDPDRELDDAPEDSDADEDSDPREDDDPHPGHVPPPAALDRPWVGAGTLTGRSLATWLVPAHAPYPNPANPTGGTAGQWETVR